MQYAAAAIILSQDTMAVRMAERFFPGSHGDIIAAAVFMAAATGLLLTSTFSGVVYFSFPIALYSVVAAWHIAAHGTGYMTLLFSIATFLNIQIIWWLLSERNNHV